MRIIAGLEQPTSGRVTVNGGDYRTSAFPMAELGARYPTSRFVLALPLTGGNIAAFSAVGGRDRRCTSCWVIEPSRTAPRPHRGGF
jgi:hypothetical protein